MSPKPAAAAAPFQLLSPWSATSKASLRSKIWFYREGSLSPDLTGWKISWRLVAKYSSFDWFILLFHSTEIDARKISARALHLCALLERSGNFHAISKRNYFPTYTLLSHIMSHSLKVSWRAFFHEGQEKEVSSSSHLNIHETKGYGRGFHC